jgi:hypothetical protein
MNKSSQRWFHFLLFAMLFLTFSIVHAQTTTFTYQGRLTDGGTAANGSYDLQFALFDTNTVGTGTQQGATITASNVTVTSGVFVVQLDFGAAAFGGANRFLEIAVKQTSASTFTTLGPRQPLTSTPYSIRSLNATTADGLSAACVSCVMSSQVQSVSGNAVSGTIPLASVPSGSANYIQNTSNQQAGSNFNVSGDGAAGGTLSGNIVNASTQYNFAGARVLSVSASLNTFVGLGAGPVNTNGDFNTNNSNSFFGAGAGNFNLTGAGNSFFGAEAGFANSTGSNNAFFGSNSGQLNTTASNNSFFGSTAGFFNTTGINNSFFGRNAGVHNTTGFSNVFSGDNAGSNNTSGFNNAFFGSGAGSNNTTGNKNTLVGFGANVSSVSNATAIGANASVSQSNSLVLGSINGINGGSADTKVGIGTTAPAEKLTVKTATDSYGFIQTDGTITVGSYVGGSTGGGWYGTKSNHSLSFFINDGPPSMTIDTGGMVRIVTLGASGSTPLCRNASNQISTCSSSLRYKTAVRSFISGLDVVNRLHPISFTWKQDGTRDLGLGAEDVDQVEPLLVIHNEKGEVEGVKYDHLNVVLINAIQEQQAQIKQQQNQIESLKRLICLDHPQAEICK